MRPLTFAAKLTTAGDTGPQRLVPLVDLIALQILVVGGTVVAQQMHRPGWHGAAVGLVVALLLVAPVVRGTTAPRALALRGTYLRNRRRRTRKRTGKAGPGSLPVEPFDVPTSDGLQIGFRWNGTTLLSLLKIDENPRALTVLEPGVTVSGEMVPVQALLDCLRQFDITLESIDIISQGARSAGHTDVAAVYDSVLGPLPAIAQRTVWIAVRFNPSRCAEAVRRRGGDRDGILRAATTATRRVANRLAEAGLQPQFLSASGIAAATNQLSDGVNLGSVEETWEDCREGHFRLSSFAVQPDMLTTPGLGLLWTVPSYSTTVCLSLRESADEDLVQVRGLVRFDSDVRVPTQLRGLTPLHGQQYSALAATLPIPAVPGAGRLGHWASGLRGDALSELALPASGCGQVIGADQEGRAVALPVFGPQIRRVEIIGTLHLAQQVVLRSLALGARVLVHTRRPAYWRDMVDAVGRHDLLWVADFNRRAIQAGAERNYTVEMFDGVPEQSVRIGVTTMVLAPPNTPASEHADVVLDLISLEHDTVKASTQAGSAVVTMVATDDEMRYLRASANSTD
ncbi:type VII secretion protein EccE [Mycolicibacterium setense]